MFALLTGFMLYKNKKIVFKTVVRDFPMKRKPDIKPAMKMIDFDSGKNRKKKSDNLLNN